MLFSYFSLFLVYNIFLRLSLGILSILFSNLLKIIKTEECSNDKNVLKIVQKEIYISYIQYATSYILPTLILLLLDFVGVVLSFFFVFFVKLSREARHAFKVFKGKKRGMTAEEEQRGSFVSRNFFLVFFVF